MARSVVLPLLLVLFASMTSTLRPTSGCSRHPQTRPTRRHSSASLAEDASQSSGRSPPHARRPRTAYTPAAASVTATVRPHPKSVPPVSVQDLHQGAKGDGTAALQTRLQHTNRAQNTAAQSHLIVDDPGIWARDALFLARPGRHAQADASTHRQMRSSSAACLVPAVARHGGPVAKRDCLDAPHQPTQLRVGQLV